MLAAQIALIAESDDAWCCGWPILILSGIGMLGMLGHFVKWLESDGPAEFATGCLVTPVVFVGRLVSWVFFSYDRPQVAALKAEYRQRRQEVLNAPLDKLGKKVTLAAVDAWYRRELAKLMGLKDIK